MKFFTKHLMFALLASLLSTFAVTAQDTETTVTNPYYIPGFFGHPLLAKDGYIATAGAWDIQVGTSDAYHRDFSTYFDFITDEIPDNFDPDRFSLVGLTLAYDEIIAVLPDPKYEGEVKPLPIGKKVGFVVSPGGNDVDVLNLSVISMSVINFLDREGNIIKSVATKEGSNLDLLNLSVININGGSAVQKLVAKISEGDPDLRDENNESKVYGISLSNAGVSADLGKTFKILYAFIDDYEEVPIIKKYYPFATGTSSGMTSGASQLVDNNLNNGASTAVLNIGGAYYNVKVNEYYTHDYTDALGHHKLGDPVIFPKGVEAGWVISGGQLLTLDLGQAYKMRGITKEGDYVDIATSVSVVGASLVGGGTTRLSFITPDDVDLVGFRLENIKGVSLELGATIYNYAYIKVPTFENFIPQRITPFNAQIEAVPSSTTNYDNGKITNTYSNDLRFANDPENPLKIPSAYSSNELGSVWQKRTNGDAIFGDNILYNYHLVQLGLSRKTIYEDGTEDSPVNLGNFDIVYNTDGKGSNGNAYFYDKAVYWRYMKNPNAAEKNNYFGKDQMLTVTDGIIDLTPISLASYSKYSDGFMRPSHFKANPYEDVLSEEIKQVVIDEKGNYTVKNVVGYEYGLYYIRPTEDAKKIENFAEECIPLSISYVTVPDYRPEFELAGSVDYININENTLTTVAPHNDSGSTEVSSDNIVDGPVIDKDLYHHYVSFEIPDKTDEKVNIKSVTLYRYDGSNHDALQTYAWDGSNWKEQIKENEGKYNLGYAKVSELTDEEGNVLEYHHKLVALIDDPSDNYEYGLAYTLQLDPDYEKLLKDTYKTEYTTPRSLDYEWYKGTKREYAIPELNHTESVPMAVGDNVKVTSYWDLTLNEAKDMHNAQLRNDEKDVLNAEWLDNVEILYNQWTTLDTKENVNARSMVRAYDAETEVVETPEFPVTDLTVSFNSAVNSDDVPYINAAAAYPEYLDSTVKEDSQLKAEVTYTSNVVGQDMLYSATARAYVPVVPYGFQSLVTGEGANGTEGLSNTIQTYLVVEAAMDEPIELYAVPTGVEDLTAETTEYDEQAEYYTTLGVKVVNPGTGVYIVRRGNTVTKEMIVR